MTAIDMRHVVEWTGIVFVVFLLCCAFYRVLVDGLEALAAMRRADTPAPQPRKTGSRT